MLNLQKAGGTAALFEAFAYAVGFGVVVMLLNPSNSDGLAFILKNAELVHVLFMATYVSFGLAMVVLTAALHERLRGDAPDLMKIATPFGFIWAGLAIASGMVASVGLEAVSAMYSRDSAQAASTWAAIDAIQTGLGGGIEVVGGIWVLLTSIASLRAIEFPKVLAYFGIVVGLAGVLTVFPILRGIPAFGMTRTLWFSWVGIIMLRRVHS